MVDVHKIYGVEVAAVIASHLVVTSISDVEFENHDVMLFRELCMKHSIFLVDDDDDDQEALETDDMEIVTKVVAAPLAFDDDPIKLYAAVVVKVVVDELL